MQTTEARLGQKEWSDWGERHGRQSREVTVERSGKLARYKTFTDLRRGVAHEQEYDMRGRCWMDCIGRVATRPSEREIASQMRDWEQSLST
jgi:hypothetical protein